MAILWRSRRVGAAEVGHGPRQSPVEVDAAEIVVSVGTDHHPFDRLVGWIDEWIDGNRGVTVVIQRGSSKESRHGGCRELIAHDELCRLFARATVVVSHGGPATVMDALAAGRLPIVVPRDPELGEHVDAHQLRFAQHLHRNRLAEVATEKDELFDAIDRGVAGHVDFAVDVGARVSDGVVRFADVVDDMLNASDATVSKEAPLFGPAPSGRDDGADRGTSS